MVLHCGGTVIGRFISGHMYELRISGVCEARLIVTLKARMLKIGDLVVFEYPAVR